MHFPSVWNFLNCFSALKQEQIPKGKYDVHVGMLHYKFVGLITPINSYLAFSFFHFSKTTLLRLGVCRE